MAETNFVYNIINRISLSTWIKRENKIGRLLMPWQIHLSNYIKESRLVTARHEKPFRPGITVVNLDPLTGLQVGLAVHGNYDRQGMFVSLLARVLRFLLR